MVKTARQPSPWRLASHKATSASWRSSVKSLLLPSQATIPMLARCSRRVPARENGSATAPEDARPPSRPEPGTLVLRPNRGTHRLANDTACPRSESPPRGVARPLRAVDRRSGSPECRSALEVIEVQHQHGIPTASADCPGVHLGKSVLEEQPAGEPCEGVVQCLLGEFGVVRPFLGDIPGRDDEVERCPSASRPRDFATWTTTARPSLCM